MNRHESEVTEVRRIDIDDPAVDMDLSQRLEYRGQLFTGEVAEYQDGALVSLDVYVAGVQDGPSREWCPDGTPRAAGMVRRAVAVGEHREWHPNGVLARLQVWDDEGRGRLRSESRWDERGVLVAERGRSGRSRNRP